MFPGPKCYRVLFDWVIFMTAVKYSLLKHFERKNACFHTPRLAYSRPAYLQYSHDVYSSMYSIDTQQYHTF